MRQQRLSADRSAVFPSRARAARAVLAALALALVPSAGSAARPASAGDAAPPPAAPAGPPDTLLMKDGRTFDCKKIEHLSSGKWKLVYENGEVLVPDDMVKDGLCNGAQGYEPKNDDEKAKLEKGLVPFNGRWVPKAERDASISKRSAETRKKIEDAKAHRQWRNRYKAKTANFEFEYTIPPELAKSYMDLMETYYAYFTKQFTVVKPKEKLKVCFYHDYDTFLEVAGAGYGVLAYYRFVPPRELDFFYDRLRPDETTAIMFHEAQHYLSHLFDLKFNMPHCFGESFAEYYGGSKWDPVKKTMTTGGIQQGRLTEVQTDIQGGEKWGLEKLLREERAYEHYTWGWTLVHFLMETKKYHDKFLKFYRSMPDAKDITRTSQGDYMTVKGDDLVKAFKKYMGVDDLAVLEKEWYEYIAKLSYGESVVGYEEAAFAAANTGRTIRAKRFFKLAVEKGSKNPTVYLRYGDMLGGGDDASTAIEMYKKGLELDPLNPDLYRAMGRRIRFQGGAEKEAEGKRLIKLSAELDPDNADSFMLMEEALEKTEAPSAPTGGGEGGDGR